LDDSLAMITIDFRLFANAKFRNGRQGCENLWDWSVRICAVHNGVLDEAQGSTGYA
jgi:hypothetical protein